VRALGATEVNADGHRDVLGIQVTTSEDGAGWLGFSPITHRCDGSAPPMNWTA
jgi:hypothetical protein